MTGWSLFPDTFKRCGFPSDRLSVREERRNLSELEAVDPALFARSAGRSLPSQPGEPCGDRLGDIVSTDPLIAAPAQTAVALLGFADDRGVTNALGRAGAALGPRELRRHLYRMSVGGGGELGKLQLFDLGDATPGPGNATPGISHARSQEAVHAIAEEALRTALVAGARAILIGGGHDGSIAGHSALLRSMPSGGKLATISIDPRCEVRPLDESKLRSPNAAGNRGDAIASDSTFRRLQQRWEGRFSLVQFGVQMQHCAQEDVEWSHAQGWPVLELRRLREDGVEKRFLRQLTRARASADALAVSVDLASVLAASAPGVSAPCPDGFSPGELFAFARAAGRESSVRLFEVMECAPPLDESGDTARLAAAAIWNFLAAACESS